jgi:putative peptidoglycan lipid II flippase
VQVLSFGSSIVLARVLGASSATDAYYLGLSVPVASYAILQVAIRLGAIPMLSERLTSVGSLGVTARDVVWSTVLGSLVVTVIVTAVAEFFVPMAVGGATAREARWVILELAPLGVLGALTGAFGALLAVVGSFTAAVAVMAIEPALKSMLTIAVGHDIGINALIIGNLVGSGLAALTLWNSVRRRGIRIGAPAMIDVPFVRTLLAVSAPLLVSQSVLQANPIIDKAMAGKLGAGSVTALEIGLRLCAVPTAFLTGLLITPLTASWATRKAAGGWDALRPSIRRALAVIVTFAPSIAAVGFVLRGDLVRIAYQGGAYSPHAVAKTTSVFGVTLLALPAQLLVVVVATIFVVERSTMVPMYVGLTNVVLNVALNLLLRPFFGVTGIALSTTITIYLLTLVYVVVAQRRWEALDLRAVPLRGAFRFLCLVVLVTATAWGVRSVFAPTPSRADTLLVALAVAAAAAAVHIGVLVSRVSASGYSIRFSRAWSSI